MTNAHAKSAAIISKNELKSQLLVALKAELAGAEAAYNSTKAGATHEEAKPENDKDTRALEASYLARGQAVRVEELRGAVADVEAMTTRENMPDRVVLGVVVEVDDDEKISTYFMAQHGGGAKLCDGAIQTITPKAPLGRALLGKSVGDAAEVTLAGKAKTLTITRIR
ncbi:MAG: GreA/GreB family elongation factor [Polyangiaceae bacterium]